MQHIKTHVDFIFGTAAMVWTIIGLLWVSRLSELCHPSISFAFALGAYGRWYKRVTGSAASVSLILVCVPMWACSIPVHAPTSSPEDRTVIDAAAGDLGLSTQYVDDELGAVVVELWDERRDADGDGSLDLGFGQRADCGGQAGFVRDTAVGRHELGHALGLRHVPDDGNVMNAESVGGDTTRLTAAQRHALRGAVAWLRVCRRRHSGG